MSADPYIVFFDETGEEREVVRLCWRCQSTDRYVPFRERKDAPIVSHTGIGHLGNRWFGAEKTACGMDATRSDWWHRL